jgi:hypothetical protein
MPRHRIALLPVALITGVAALSPAPAAATFHEMSIREIYPGSVANPGAEFVELQMWSPGQNLVEGHVLRTYGPTGSVIKANAFPSDVSGGANQSTIVMATSEAEAQFGFAGDAALSPSGQLDPAGGAVCWEALDCVSWGSFSGPLPGPAGSPASPAGIPDEMALRRTISPGCATLLEPTDDHDNSAIDFSPVFPAPRPNSVTPSERPCGAGGGPLGGAGGAGSQQSHGAPQTMLKHKPPHRTTDRTPTFRFAADEAGSTFQCKLDSKPFRTCRSPFTAKQLSPGHHTFRVRARDDSGTLDRSPAAYGFTVAAKRR